MMTPKPYVRRLPGSWWLARPAYALYMARELSSLFIAGYTGLLVIGLLRLAEDRAAFDAFLAALAAPGAIVFHAVALAFALVHTTTWFALAPQAMPPSVGGRKLPRAAVVAAHYAAWVVVSGAVILLAEA